MDSSDAISAMMMVKNLPDFTAEAGILFRNSIGSADLKVIGIVNAVALGQLRNHSSLSKRHDHWKICLNSLAMNR